MVRLCLHLSTYSNRRVFGTWQVRLGRKTGLIRSAVVLFPPEGTSDKKCPIGKKRSEELMELQEADVFNNSKFSVVPDVLPLWSCWSPGALTVLIHPESTEFEIWFRPQNPFSKSHLWYLVPSTEDSKRYFTIHFLEIKLGVLL